MKSVTVFEVAGRGAFPMDMLRYDEAFPVYPGDASKIAGTFTGDTAPAPIRLATAKRGGPTPARWMSFGWSYTEIDWYEVEK